MAGRFQEILQTLSSKIPQGGGGPMPKMLGLASVGVAGLAYGGGNMLFNVEGGHRAVMYHRFGGVQERVRGEGTHILLPWFQRPIIYDVRARPRIIQAMTGSHGAAPAQNTKLRTTHRRRRSGTHRRRTRHCRSADGEHHSSRAVAAECGQASDDLPGAQH